MSGLRAVCPCAGRFTADRVQRVNYTSTHCRPGRAAQKRGGRQAGAAAAAVQRPATLGWAATWQQRLWQSVAATGTDLAPSTKPSSSAALHLLQLSQQYDTQAVADRDFYKQLTAEERLARIQMLLQQGITEETVQQIIHRTKGGPYMQSASEGAAILAVLREHGFSGANLNLVLRWQPGILRRAASSIGDVFAALADMLQLSRPRILRVCLKSPSLLASSSDTLRRRWAWLQAHYGLSEAAVASLAKRMVNSRAVCSLLLFSQDTVTARLSGLQRLFELSGAEVSKLFPYLANLLEADPEQHIRPRWDLLQSLLGEFQPADKRRFILSSNDSLLIPQPTIRDVFSGVEQLMGSTAAAQSLLRRSPKSIGGGIERLATNLNSLQQLYGCSEQQAQRVLLRESQLAYIKLEAPKFQCRVAVLTEWYGHASPAAMLLAPGSGRRLCASLWLLGARMAFIRHLRLERAEPELNTDLISGVERFCRSVGVREEEYAAFEQRWLASPEAAELCCHEGPPLASKALA